MYSKPPVPNEGNDSARLVVVGGSPGAREELRGRPFCGPSGYYLDKALEGAGISRGECLITDVVPVRPENDEWYRHKVSDVQQGVQDLRQLLERVKPELVLALGENALQACVRGDPDFRPAKKTTITETRGYLQKGLHGGPVIGTVHPASFLYGGWIPFSPLFQWDVRKARRWIAGERPKERREVVLKTYEELEWACEQASKAVRISLDIEESKVIAFSWDSTVGYSIPGYTVNGVREYVQRILGNQAAKVTQNGQYDVTRLEKWGFTVANWTEDIMIKWHAIEPLLAGKSDESSRTEKSLRFFASMATWEEWWKNYQFDSQEAEWSLCAKDARIQLEVWEWLEELLNRRMGVVGR